MVKVHQGIAHFEIVEGHIGSHGQQIYNMQFRKTKPDMLICFHYVLANKKQNFQLLTNKCWQQHNVIYKKAIPSASTFNPWVILSVIHDNANGRKEIGLNELLTGEKNIGKVFNLDSITMLDVLHVAERTGEIKIIRTAGLDIVNLTHEYSFEECVKRYYDDIETVE